MYNKSNHKFQIGCRHTTNCMLLYQRYLTARLVFIDFHHNTIFFSSFSLLLCKKKVYKPSQHLSRSNSQPSRPKSGLKRYSSLEEATEHEKELIRTSLTDLCFRQEPMNQRIGSQPNLLDLKSALEKPTFFSVYILRLLEQELFTNYVGMILTFFFDFVYTFYLIKVNIFDHLHL